MAQFKWDDSLRTGIAPVDADHHLLIGLINQLDEAVLAGEGREVIGSVLTVLLEYVETHFAREEGFMARAGYPGLAEHRRQHADLAARVRDISERYSRDQIRVLDRELLGFLKTWLIDHIMKTDMAYRPFVGKLALGADDMFLDVGLLNPEEGALL
jgi:hemerythrin-like metal-binding protein